MAESNIKEELKNTDRLPFTHRYWEKHPKGDVSFKHTSFSKRYNSQRSLKEVFYKFIVRL